MTQPSRPFDFVYTSQFKWPDDVIESKTATALLILSV